MVGESVVCSFTVELDVLCEGLEAQCQDASICDDSTRTFQ